MQFIASLSADQRREMTLKSNKKGLLHLLFHALTLVFVGALIQIRVPGWQFLMIPQGICLIFLFTLLHETLHATAFRSKSINIYLGYICGFLLLIPPLWFRYFHFAHHRHTQDPKRDPELQTPKPETRSEYMLHVSGIPTWVSQLKTLVQNASGKISEPYIPNTAIDKVRVESRIFLKLYVLIFILQFIFQSTALLYLWVIPLLIGQPFLRLYLLAEHGRCPFVENMFVNTRTTFTSALVRRLAWNMPYHAEHHAMPSVPFHALPKLHDLTQEHLQSTAKGYREFNKSYLAKIK
ncbi:MAG: fatty acid desaturase [Alphaproteobacteria bacterium]